MKRLEDISLTEAPLLTQLALGVSNEAFVSNKLMPEVFVDSNTGEYPIFPADAMKVPENIERPFKSDKIQKKVMSGFTKGEFKLQEYALGTDIDKDEMEEASARSMLAIDTYYMEIIMESMYLAQEKKRVDMLLTSGNYASGNTDALTGTDCWDNASSTPLVQLQDDMATIRSKTGKLPNLLVLGQPSLTALQNHSTLIEKIKYSQKAIVSTDLIAELLSTKDNPVEVVVGSGFYLDRTTGLYTDLWNDSAILAYVPKSAANRRSKYTPAFGYTFTKRGYPYAGEERGKFGLIKTVGTFMKYQAAIVQNSAGFLITNTKGS